MLRSMLARLAAYRAHPDPRVATANTLALVLAYNGPFYPLYLYWLIGRAAWPSLIALWAVPFYAAVPALARRHPLAGRLLLVGLATGNSALYVKMFGASAQLQLFLLPVILLGLLFARHERYLAWALSGIALILYVVLRNHAGAPIRPFDAAQYAAMRGLSEVSVATLCWFMMVLFGGMASELSRGAAAGSMR